MKDTSIPMVGFCAWSGTGKTTLLAKLLPILKQSGLRVGVVKHAHHSFDIDHPGKDSYVLRVAGASQMLIASRNRMAHITEFEQGNEEPSLADALAGLDMNALDLVLVEGFKHEHYRKIELHRPELNKPLLFPDDPDVIAVASDTPITVNRNGLPKLDLNNPEQIVQFILDAVIGEEPAYSIGGAGQP